MTYYDFMAKWHSYLHIEDRAAFEKDTVALYMSSRMIGYDSGVARADNVEDQLQKIAEIVCDN